jgi:dTDP-4-amino-4,6-dideoxygalactose transaminase
MSNIAASYGLAQMKNIDKLLSIRYNNHKTLLDMGLNLHTYTTDNKTGTWMNILKCQDAESMMNFLRKYYNIESKLYYKSILNAIGAKDENSRGRKAYETCLYLPSSLKLNQKDMEYIGKAVNAY